MKFLILSLLFSLFSFAGFSRTFGVLGDGGVWNENTFSIRKAMLKGEVKNLILPGDNLYDLTQEYSDAWGPWRSKGFAFPIVALGNHFKQVETELRYFGLRRTYYAKDIGEANFIVLDSQQESLVAPQVEWLKERLRELNENQKVIVVFHHPPVTISHRHNWWEKKGFHDAILPILLENKKKIDLVLVGHDHIASFFTVNGIPFVVSGASMEIIPTKPFSYFDEERELLVETRWFFNNKDPYWARMDVGRNDIWINFVNAKQDKVDCSIRLTEKFKHLKANCFEELTSDQ